MSNQKLRQARKQRHWTQEQASARIGVAVGSQTAIWAFQRTFFFSLPSQISQRPLYTEKQRGSIRSFQAPTRAFTHLLMSS